MDGRSLLASTQDEVRHTRGAAHCTPRSLPAPPQRSRFYGPIVHTLAPAIAPWVDEWMSLIEFDMPPEKPFLFSLATDWERGHTSSSWTAVVKAAFERHAGVPCPPKVCVPMSGALTCTIPSSHERYAQQDNPPLPPPVQLLRTSFCTFLRSHEEGVDQELRESVAKAM